MESAKESVRKICSLLNKHEVEYMLIGGWAVIFHGYPRATADIDFWYKPTLANFHKLLNAFDEYGVDTQELKSIVFDPQKTFLRLPLGIKAEFLPQVPGIGTFNDAKQKAIYTDFEDVKIFVLGMDDLIQNKSHLNRLKDQNDIEELKKRRKI